MVEKVQNVEFHEGHAIVHVNPELYSVEAVLNAGYVLTEEAYVIIDGDIDRKLSVVLKPKSKKSLKKLALEFGNQLIHSQVYLLESAKQTAITDTIVSQALAGLQEDENQPEDK